MSRESYRFPAPGRSDFFQASFGCEVAEKRVPRFLWVCWDRASKLPELRSHADDATDLKPCTGPSPPTLRVGLLLENLVLTTLPPLCWRDLGHLFVESGGGVGKS